MLFFRPIQNRSKQRITYVGQRNKSSATLRSVIRLPNKRLSTKAFHINRKINHPSIVSKPHATTRISILTELLHMKSLKSYIELWIYIVKQSIFNRARRRNTICSHQRRHRTVCWGDFGSLSLPLRFGVQRARHSLPRVRSRKRKI